MTAREVEATAIVAAPISAIEPTDAPSAVKRGFGILSSSFQPRNDVIDSVSGKC